MMSILDQQLLLHDAASLCSLGLMRAAARPDGAPEPILGESLDKQQLLERLRPAIELISTGDQLQERADLEGLLHEIYSRVVKRAAALAGREGFVPAACWIDHARDLFLEHVRYEVDVLAGGVRAEAVWQSFNGLPDTAPLEELIVSGMLIKLRALGAFLALPPTRHEDELTAAAFFTAGAWEQCRDASTAARVAAVQRPVNKQIAHITFARPLPEEIGVERPSTFLHFMLDAATLLEQFTAMADARLLPDWWREWAPGVRGAPRVIAGSGRRRSEAPRSAAPDEPPAADCSHRDPLPNCNSAVRV